MCRKDATFYGRIARKIEPYLGGGEFDVCFSVDCAGPMESNGFRPAWLRELMRDFDGEPERRWTDQDLRDRGLSPERVRRWFQSHHGMTFHAYGRARRLGLALG